MADPVEAAGQVRAFPPYRGQRNFSGRYWAATCCSELVGYESWVEPGHLMRLDAEPDVVAVVSQPFPLSWRCGSRGRRIRAHAGLLRTQAERLGRAVLRIVQGRRMYLLSRVSRDGALCPLRAVRASL